MYWTIMMLYLGRSPHGERGLKFETIGQMGVPIPVAPHTGSVD